MKTRNIDDVLARIEQIVNISPDLDTEFRSQAANYSWLSSYFVEAKDKVRRLKNQLDIKRANLSDIARKEFADKKVTKDVIEGWVIRRTEFQQALGDLFDAQLAEDRLTAGVRSLDFKRDSLMSLGANMRLEISENIREPVVRGYKR